MVDWTPLPPVEVNRDAGEKAAWFPKRPFQSYGGLTFVGDFRTFGPGAYLPAAS